jgi:hypothetical protein
MGNGNRERERVRAALEYEIELTPAMVTGAGLTPEMIDAGEQIILGETGGAGATLSGLFSASSLATRVYLAMYCARAEG